MTSNDSTRWFQNSALWEILLIFGLFALYGAYPIPDVNEQYYVGKAIHFWNPDYFPTDAFLDAPDSHWFYCAVFGLFSKIFSPAALVWFGRILVWFGTAVGWQRLSTALIPRRWWSVAAAAGFLFFLEHFHLAGEWVAGGVEGKGFAFPFVFLGLAAILRNRFNLGFLLMGIGSAFHVLVGGWGVAAALGALFIGKQTPLRNGTIQGLSDWKRYLPGLIAGGLFSLFGLIPAFLLDAGTPAETVFEAHKIYVYQRLAHHLVPSSLPWTFLLRFGLLTGLWFLFARLFAYSSESVPEENRQARLFWNRFTLWAVFFALIGLILDFGTLDTSYRDSAARLLRFYWFRLSDWVIPAAAAFGGIGILTEYLPQSDKKGRFPLGLLTIAALLFLAVKFGYRYYAQQLADAATVDPNWPALPKPTDGVAFLTVTAVFALLGYIICKIKKKTVLQGPVTAAVLILLTCAPVFGLVSMLHFKTEPIVPRSAPPKDSIARGWLDVCRWVKANTPADAVFLVPKGCDSFKWNAQRADAGSWKEMPQDARSIVEWYGKMKELYLPIGNETPAAWNQPLVAVLINKGIHRYERLADKYHFDYIISELPPYQITSFPKAQKRYDEFAEKKVYQNGHFVIFKIRSGENPE